MIGWRRAESAAAPAEAYVESADKDKDGPAETPAQIAMHQGMTKIALAIVAAGALIAIAMPSSPSSETQTYQGLIADGRIVRLNTDNGNIVACDWTKCVRILGNGKEVSRGALEPPRTQAAQPLAPPGGEAAPAR
jgi:hypothetical protein